MSLTLTLHTTPDVPLEADVISPDQLTGKTVSEIEVLTLHHGNQTVALADFFKVGGQAGDEIVVDGADLSRVKLIGRGMTRGRLRVLASVGMHVGAAMSGGELLVEGNAGDWAGAEMRGGRLIISGDAGHLLGSGYRGSHAGMGGGEIIVHGGVGNEVGGAMRRGLIAIGGDTGDFTGVNMLAGTIVVLGRLGWRTGAGMLRGTIVSMHDTELLPTFSYATTYQPTFLRLYLLHLRALGLPVEEQQLSGRYRRWSGDAVQLNRGEILLYQN
ncbi:MAG TPA: formylmethanofuran dehydrogenase subunit C [Anaerolineae bacterium]|nr:formylmethanofuran dehydrogenase subunit C [Anaerolineae bacterium]